MKTVKILLALAVIAMCTTSAMAQDGQKKKRQGARLNRSIAVERVTP